MRGQKITDAKDGSGFCALPVKNIKHERGLVRVNASTLVSRVYVSLIFQLAK